MTVPLSPGARERVLADWIAALGAPASAFAGDGTTLVARDDLRAVVAVRLGGALVVAAPRAAHATLAALTSTETLDAVATAAALAVADPTARVIGSAELRYLEVVTDPRRDGDRAEPRPTIAPGDPDALAALRAAVDPAEWDEAGLEGMPHVVVASIEGDPVAAAGWEPWRASIAQVGVLTALDARGRGIGAVVARSAIADALAAGRIAQWRSALDNAASLAAGRRLGGEALGRQATVALDGPRVS